MKWDLASDKKSWKNYKGEKFDGKMARDLNQGDSYEVIGENGKNVLRTIESKETSENGSVIVFVKGVEV